MDSTEFYNSFSFQTFSFNRYHYTDARSGAATNYIALMLKGSARIVTKSERLEIGAGDYFFIPRWLPYQSFWESDGEVRWISLGFDTYPDSEMRQFSLQKLYPDETGRRLVEAASAGRSPRTIGLLYELLDRLMPSMKTENRRVLQAVADKMLRSDFRCPVEEIARSCGMSVSGFYPAFKRETGLTPNEFRRHIIISMACGLLETTDLPVEEITRRLGFSSSSYFRKIFFMETGKTPTMVRKEAVL